MLLILDETGPRGASGGLGGPRGALGGLRSRSDPVRFGLWREDLVRTIRQHTNHQQIGVSPRQPSLQIVQAELVRERNFEDAVLLARATKRLKSWFHIHHWKSQRNVDTAHICTRCRLLVVGAKACTCKRLCAGSQGGPRGVPGGDTQKPQSQTPANSRLLEEPPKAGLPSSSKRWGGGSQRAGGGGRVGLGSRVCLFQTLLGRKSRRISVSSQPWVCTSCGNVSRE